MIITVPLFVLLVIGLIVLAERSIRRQRGSLLRRSAKEDRAIGHANVMRGWKGGGSG